MPYDSSTLADITTAPVSIRFDDLPADLSRQDMIALFQRRRLAAAEVWNNVPTCMFDMTTWECGSKACALGWLANEQHAGWSFSERSTSFHGRVPKTPDGILGYRGAALWFGLSVAQATACFSADRHSNWWKFHRRWFPGRVTPSDVGRTLLSLPYRVPST